MPKHSLIRLTTTILVFVLLAACTADQTGEAVLIFVTDTAVVPVTPTTSITLSPTTTPTMIPSATTVPISNPSATDTSTLTPTPTTTVKPVDPFEMVHQAVDISYNAPFGNQDVVAYRIEDSRIVAFDFANFENPKTIWQSDVLGEQISGLEVVANQAYVLVDDELFIWDVKIPNQPALISKIPIEGQLFLDGDNKYLYFVSILDEQSEIVTLDIQNPLNPVELGRVKMPWTFPFYYPLEIAQNRLILVNDNNLEIFDITDPQNVILSASFPLPTNTTASIEVEENLLFVRASSGLMVLDLTDPYEPIELSQYRNIQFSNWTILDDKIYLLWQICGWEANDNDEVSGGCSYGIDVVDIKNPVKLESTGVLRFETDTNQQWLDSSLIFGHLMYLETDKHSEDGSKYYVLDLTGIVD